MPPRDTNQPPEDGLANQPSIRCTACNSALQSPGRDTVSFLLIDHLKIPIVGCGDHLEQFSSVCGLTTEADPELLGHLPAGGVPCIGCRQERYTPEQSLLRIDGGALAVLACPTHQSAIIDRYRTGLQTQQHLTSSLDTV